MEAMEIRRLVKDMEGIMYDTVIEDTAVVKRMYYTTLEVPCKATLIQGTVLFAQYGDWDIVWHTGIDALPTIKNMAYNKKIIEMVACDLTPILLHMQDRYTLIHKNYEILSTTDEVVDVA